MFTGTSQWSSSETVATAANFCRGCAIPANLTFNSQTVLLSLHCVSDFAVAELCEHLHVLQTFALLTVDGVVMSVPAGVQLFILSKCYITVLCC
jgi:hypothetical protein